MQARDFLVDRGVAEIGELAIEFVAALGYRNIRVDGKVGVEIARHIFVPLGGRSGRRRRGAAGDQRKNAGHKDRGS